MPRTLRRWYAGDVLTLRATFTDPATGDLIDPAVVEFKYSISGGSVVRFVYGTNAAITRISIGLYQVVIDTTGHPGLYNYIWASHGYGQSVISKAILVQQGTISTSFSGEPLDTGVLVATSLSEYQEGMYNGVTLPTYRAGQIITFTVYFSDKFTGAPVDPTAVEFAYQATGGSVVRYRYLDSTNIILHPTTGEYQISIDSTDQPGVLMYTWSSSAVGQSDLNQSLYIRPTAIDSNP